VTVSWTRRIYWRRPWISVVGARAELSDPRTEWPAQIWQNMHQQGL